MGTYQTAEAAYWGFFETFNERSASGRAGVMSYPHLRVSTAAAPRLTATPDEYEAAAPRQFQHVEQSGWAWTQPITPRIVHRSPDKVHFAGGWTRFRADGSAISQNRLLYIATEIDGGWGIQAAFGVDGDLRGAESAPVNAAALAALERTMTALAAGAVETWLDCFHYPLAIVFAPEQIAIYAAREDAAAAYSEWVAQAAPLTQTAAVTAAGPSAALVEQNITHGGVYFEQSFLFVERDGVWAASAVSAVRPDG